MNETRPDGVFRVFALLAAVALLATACPQKKVITCKANEAFDPVKGVCYPCPAGTKVDKKTASCVPDNSVVDVVEVDTFVPDVVDDEGKDVVDLTDGLSDMDTEESDGVVAPDEVAAEIVPSGAIGSACNMDGNCIGDWTCFDWPGGYCIQSDCSDEKDCPENTHCLPLLENSQACFQECSSMAECRDGYGCKGLTGIDGITQYICHPLGTQNLPLGSPCTGPAVCAGELGCVSLGPASMCTLTGCSSSDPCPEGATCTIRGDFTLCLPDCETTADCDPSFDGDVVCQEMEDIDGKDKMLCGSALTGLPLGSECYANEDCQSGYCHLLVIGQCSDTGSLCGSDGDCQQGFCIEKQVHHRGVCSAYCGSGVPCEGGAYCVLTEEGPLCMLQCEDFGASCGPTGLDMTCRYGLIFYPQVPSGKAACVKIKSGEPGTLCDANVDCLSGGECFHLDGEDGYCINSCWSNTDCPFGTACVTEEAVCRRVCKSNLDCPDGFSCRSDTGSSENLCLLE